MDIEGKPLAWRFIYREADNWLVGIEYVKTKRFIETGGWWRIPIEVAIHQTFQEKIAGTVGQKQNEHRNWC